MASFRLFSQQESSEESEEDLNNDTVLPIAEDQESLISTTPAERSRRNSPEEEDGSFNRLGLASKGISMFGGSSLGVKKPASSNKHNRKRRASAFAAFHHTRPKAPTDTPILPRKETPSPQPIPQEPMFIPSPEVHIGNDYHPRQVTSPEILMEEVVSVDGGSSHYTDDLPEIKEEGAIVRRFKEIIFNNEEKIYGIVYRLRQKNRRYLRHKPPERSDSGLCSCCWQYWDSTRDKFWRLFYFIWDKFDRVDDSRRDKMREARYGVSSDH